ncbi:class I SAM-dependent methyltransferase [Mycobacterium sp.]|uniref:class I SAM-dependent methyltransferase n=1 Tax=Mycobacterium sp. TaxID=1785 RepID=UPI002C42E652|nr:class I SAM-dependent methyltransferase [Mycobacterium sp.]HTH88686.1 class I SAM-dependent methyltransferase [Mycobacterium sp.]
MDSPPVGSVNPTLLREAMARRLYRRSVVTGQITLPAVPAMIDEYVTMCDKIFAAVGRNFTAEQLANAKSSLEGQLAEAFAASQRSNIVISFNAPVGTVLNYHVKPEWFTVEGTYEQWVATREPPLFGTEPDARVLALADETADPTTYRVLDIGAGTGRNALALARRGHPTDVVEVTAKFADMIRSDAERESLDVRVIRRDVFETMDDLRQDYQLIVLSEVVSDFRTTEHLRGMFELAAQCLAPGGRLLFNAFLARDGYTPDNATRQLGQQVYTSIFTHEEMSTAAAQLPLELVADDSACEYEKAHLPDGAWPPTGWYDEWASGLDLFDIEREQCPIELRWLVYKKTA